jgi:hypothetical protein
MARRQHFEHLATRCREPLRAFGANRFRMGDCDGTAPGVVVIGCEENRGHDSFPINR